MAIQGARVKALFIHLMGAVPLDGVFTKMFFFSFLHFCYIGVRHFAKACGYSYHSFQSSLKSVLSNSTRVEHRLSPPKKMRSVPHNVDPRMRLERGGVSGDDDGGDVVWVVW